MSWWYGVHADLGGPEPATLTDENVTYNLGGMFREALGIDFRDLDGAPCSEAGGVLTAAVEAMRADPDRFKALNPPNGWGDYDVALQTLEHMRDWCARYPRAELYVH